MKKLTTGLCVALFALSGTASYAADEKKAVIKAFDATMQTRPEYANRISYVIAPDGKVVYHCGGTEIALFPKPDGTKAEHTALSFRVDDIRSSIAELEGRGVVFADYDLPGFKTVEHVCVLGSEKAAWFNDPEGNILCLHEDIA